MNNYFQDVLKIVDQKLLSDEKYTAWFSGETLDYARFNHAKIRQAGTVCQHNLELDLIKGQKHASATLGLSKNLSVDTEKIASTLAYLRTNLAHSTDDPYLMINEEPHSTEFVAPNTLGDKFAIVESVIEEARALDLVGSYIGGPIYKGFANSLGQRNWFEKSSFIIDTSIYHSGDKAIKQSYCDTSFEPKKFQQKIAAAHIGLELFKQESISIKPGAYRVYFSPSAVHEMLSMLNWGGFSRKSLEVKSSSLQPLWGGEKTLSPAFSLFENTHAGVGPNFQSAGFLKPDKLPIIEAGVLKNTLISPKTAKEYRLDHNGADDEEQVGAIEMSAGELKDSEILSTLGDGLYINNLWYLNFSDRQNGRLTGMTRFLCFVVKNGRPAAPFSVMRFDDSIYRIFGENLDAITSAREMIIDNSTYEEMSTASAHVPGIIVNNVRFTL
jgi:predicted Zn-dependent protease